MIINLSGWRTVVTRLRPVVLLGAGGVIGFWLGALRADGVRLLLATGIIAVAALVTVAWQARFRSRERWHALLNRYAEREIARAQRRNTLRRAT